MLHMPDAKVTSSVHPTHVSFPAPDCFLLWVEKKVHKQDI